MGKKEVYSLWNELHNLIWPWHSQIPRSHMLQELGLSNGKTTWLIVKLLTKEFLSWPGRLVHYYIPMGSLRVLTHMPIYHRFQRVNVSLTLEPRSPVFSLLHSNLGENRHNHSFVFLGANQISEQGIAFTWHSSRYSIKSLALGWQHNPRAMSSLDVTNCWLMLEQNCTVNISYSLLFSVTHPDVIDVTWEIIIHNSI